MSVVFPGKILVVDNREEDVSDVVKSFRDAGQGVFYLQGPPSEGKCPANIRLIILDLDLDGCGDIRDEDLENVALVLQRVGSRTRFYLVALWSEHITETESWVDRVRDKYSEQTGEEFPAFFLKPFAKKIGQEKLIEEIEKWVEENPQAGIVFEWEKSIEEARDGATSDVTNAGGIRSVIGAIEKEVGREATPRELVTLFNRILLRHSLAKRTRLASLVTEVLQTKKVPQRDILDWYAGFHYLGAYFKVQTAEALWTGDILERDVTGDPEKAYAVVITPACDFAWKKAEKVKLAYGIKVQVVPVYRRDDSDVPVPVKTFGKEKDGKYMERGRVVGAIASGTGLPARFYVLRFLRSLSNPESYFHLIVDFSRVESISTERDSQGNLKIPNGWHRICRLDSPYVEDLLQKYASISARVGTPDIPEDIVKKEKERLQS